MGEVYCFVIRDERRERRKEIGSVSHAAFRHQGNERDSGTRPP